MNAQYKKFRADFPLIATGTLLKVFLTFALNKILALGLGPGPFSEYGQYYVVLTFLYTASSLGLANAHTVYVASNSSYNMEIAGQVTTAERKELSYLIALLGGGGVGILVLGSLLFLGERFDFLPKFSLWFLFLILLYCLIAPLGVAMMAASVAERRYGRQQAISTGTTFISMTLMVCLLWSGEMRAEIAAAAYCIGFFLPVLMLGKVPLRASLVKTENFAAALRFYRPFIIPGVAGSLIGSAATMIVLTMVRGNLPIEHSGSWFGIWRLSEAYTGLVLAVSSALCLPRMARAGTNLGKEIARSIVLMFSLYMPLLIMLLFFPERTMALFFSQNFSMNLPSLWPQVVGDLLKLSCAAHILALSAIAAPKWILLAEVVFAATFVFGGSVMITSKEMSGVLLAYAGSYFLLFALLVFLLRRVAANSYITLSPKIK